MAGLLMTGRHHSSQSPDPYTHFNICVLKMKTAHVPLLPFHLSFNFSHLMQVFSFNLQLL